MNQKQRTKLELIRLEGICKMIMDKVPSDELKNRIENVTGSSVQDCKSALYRLPRYQLIRIIELAASLISSEDIDAAYEQYRYGLKPGFTLFSINTKCKKCSQSAVITAINEELIKIVDGEEDKYKGLKYKSYTKIDEEVTEYSFSYLSKYSYLSEEEEPKFVYEFEEVFVWISIKDGFLAIKNAPDKVGTILKRIFSAIYNTQISNIKITKTLINKIFGENNLRKGSYIKLNASDSEAEKVTISDSRFAEKPSVMDSVDGYDMTGTYLNEELENNESSTLGINCNKGKVYLTKNVTASTFRNWSVKRIKDIISYLNLDGSSNEFDIFKAKNITDSSRWNEYNTVQKSLIEQICFAIYMFCKTDQSVAMLQNHCSLYRETLMGSFYDRLLLNCNQCEDASFPKCACGSNNLSITKDKQILCHNCGDRSKVLYCDVGHSMDISDIYDVINILPTANFIEQITAELKDRFAVEFSGSFSIQGQAITMLPQNAGGLIDIYDIPELKDTISMKISEDETDVLLGEIQKIKEKCNSSSNNACDRCQPTNRECIMKLFTIYPSYRPSPHQGNEFGDVNFPVTVKGKAFELVGVAKSAGTESLTPASKSGREMIQQTLLFTHDKRIGIIAAICPMHFHDQMSQELAYISRLSGVKICILDDRFMIRQLKSYRQIHTNNK